MTRTRPAIVATVCTSMITGVAMLLLGMEPRLVLVGCVVVVVAATAWLVVDLGLATSPLVWYNYGTEADTSARPDRRVQLLRSRLRQSARRRSLPTSIADGRDEIVDSLVRIIDDHLSAEHGIDMSTDPDAAAELLGPELHRFVSDPTSQQSMVGRRKLARTVALIEDL